MSFARSSRLCLAMTSFVSLLLANKSVAESRRRRRFLRCAATALLVLLGSGFSWASFSLTFQGLAQPLNSGGITLAQPTAVAVDAAGNIYIADTTNNRIVEVNAQGVASVVAITGLSPALSLPIAITVDGSGDLYVADAGNNRVVEITAAGAGSAISTGSLNLIFPRGVALDQSGNLFIADSGNNRIVEVTAVGSAAALSITVSSGSSTFDYPTGLAVNVSGKLYISDTNNNRIVTVAPGSTTGVVASILGGVTLSEPLAVAVDRIGNIFIADYGNSRIAEIDTSSNGTVLFTNPIELDTPVGVALDVFGTVYIADAGLGEVVVADPSVNADLAPGDETYSLNKTAVGFGHVPLGTSTAVTLTLPFTTDFSSGLGAVKVLTSGQQSLDFTSGTDTTCNSSTGPSTFCTVEVTFLPTAPGLRNGSVVLYDTGLNPILSVPLYGWADAPVAALAPNTGSVINTGGLTLSNPYQLALDGSGNMYVGDYTGKNVTRIAAGGGSAALVNFGTPGGIALQNITGVAVDGAGNLFVGDHQNNRILVVTPGGVVSVLAITGLSPALGFPTALAFDGAGNLYIADFTVGRIVEISTLVVAGSASSGNATVINTGSYSFTSSTVTGMTVDSQGTIYIAARTQNNSSIVKVTAAGVAAEIAIPGNITPPISNPQGVGVDAMGNLYIVDTAHSRIVEITTAGVASVLSISGLTSPSTLGSLIFGVTADPSGNIYIQDWTNNRIVYVNVSSAALTFANTNVGSTSSDSPKTSTVTNLGDQALVIAANPAYTANFSQAPGGTNQCLASTSVSAGTACNVTVQFTPQSVGSLSAGITVTDNTLNVSSSTQQVAVSGTGLNAGDTTAVAVSTNPTAANIGQPLTVTAIVTDTTAGHTATIPTGGVTFTDTVGSTVISLNGGTAVTLNGAGQAILAGVTLSGAGVHTITANYLGVVNTFLTSTNITMLTVSKDTAAIAGPLTQPVQVVVGQAGSVPITVTGPYTVVSPPTGSLGYNVLNSSNVSVASGTAPLTPGETNSTATVPILSTLAPGSYTVNVIYAGDSNYAAVSTATVIQVVVGQITPTINWTQPAPITYGAALSVVLTAAAVNGSTPVLGAFAYTATIQGGSAVSVTGATILGGGSYTLIASFTPTDTTTYTSATGSVSLTVAKATVSNALTSSVATVLVKNAVTFTSTVSSSVSTPSGSVGFYDGTTLLGSGTLAQGVAAFMTTSLAVGAHSITAAYGGDRNFSALTSSAVTETVEDFTLNIATGGSTSATVQPGGTAVYALTIAPSSGLTFPAAIALTVAGLPSGATATIVPQTLPAGAGSTNVALTIQVPSQSASLRHSDNALLALKLSPLMLGMLLLPFGGSIRRNVGKRGRTGHLLLLVLACASVAGLTGCGARNSGFFGNQPQNYTLTLTATSGTLSHSTTLTLTVK